MRTVVVAIASSVMTILASNLVQKTQAAHDCTEEVSDAVSEATGDILAEIGKCLDNSKTLAEARNCTEL
jgi:hypothetical protein